MKQPRRRLFPILETNEERILVNTLLRNILDYYLFQRQINNRIVYSQQLSPIFINELYPSVDIVYLFYRQQLRQSFPHVNGLETKKYLKYIVVYYFTFLLIFFTQGQHGSTRQHANSKVLSWKLLQEKFIKCVLPRATVLPYLFLYLFFYFQRQMNNRIVQPIVVSKYFK